MEPALNNFGVYIYPRKLVCQGIFVKPTKYDGTIPKIVQHQQFLESHSLQVFLSVKSSCLVGEFFFNFQNNCTPSFTCTTLHLNE